MLTDTLNQKALQDKVRTQRMAEFGSSDLS